MSELVFRDLNNSVFEAWFDDNPKAPVEEKIRAACECFARKHGEAATTVLVNEGLEIEVEGLQIVREQWVRPNHFWAGRLAVAATGAAIGVEA